MSRLRLVFGLSILVASAVGAAEPLSVAKRIDVEIEKHLRDAKLTPAPLADDAEYLPRAYLDITGRVPTAKQTVAFLDSTDKDKRAKLINELLASSNYGEQFGRVWRDWIAP